MGEYMTTLLLLLLLGVLLTIGLRALPSSDMRKGFWVLPLWDDLLLWGGLLGSALSFGLLLLYLLWRP